MPYLDAIVTEINDSIKSKLTGENFLLSLQGISKQLLRTDSDETQIPSYVSNDGEGVFNFINDQFTVNIYHKCEAIPYESFDFGFGDDDTYKKENAQMAMFVYGKRSVLKMTENELISTITSSLPSILSKDFKLSKPGLSAASIQITNIDNKAQDIWRREFINIDYPLLPESILFQVNYTITTVINTLCFEPCHQCN